jgi:hypothetical protein
MSVEEIRQVVRQRPFKPFVFHLDNGQKYSIKHPGIIVSNQLIMTMDDNAKAIFIAPEAVTSIEFMEAETLISGSTADKP